MQKHNARGPAPVCAAASNLAEETAGGTIAIKSMKPRAGVVHAADSDGGFEGSENALANPFSPKNARGIAQSHKTHRAGARRVLVETRQPSP